MRNNTNPAKVSLMITSEQRYKLSTILGYTTEDIRTFKPHEAHLLLQHGIRKDTNNDGSSDDHVGMGDFRTMLNALLIKEEEKENKRSTSHTDLQGTKFNDAVNNSASGEQHNDERMTKLSMNDDNDTMMSSTSLAVLPEQTDVALDKPSHLQHTNLNVDATIPIIEEQLVREEQIYSRVLRTDVITNDVELDNITGTCWYEVIEKTPKMMDDDYEEQVVALFRTEKEALECVKIKTTIHLSRSSKAEGKNACLDDERYLVRKRGDISE
jgi:hypothetical protein